MVDVRPRRSNRTHNTPWHQRRRGAELFAQLEPYWRRLYVDLGHCRLRKCRQRVEQASVTQLEALPCGAIGRIAFTAVAIAASSAYGSSKEDELCMYVQAVIQRGLDANDTHHDNSAVALAAYHGYVAVLRVLLATGCSLESHGEYGNAVMAAVRNVQHGALELLLQQPTAFTFANAVLVYYPSGESVLERAIINRDVVSVRLLVRCGVLLSNRDFVRLCASKLEKTRFEPLLRELHPGLPSVVYWSAELHWSFPAADREALALLWHALHRHSAYDLLPGELWLRVFGFVKRGWWSSRELFPQGRPMSNVISANILLDEAAVS